MINYPSHFIHTYIG